MTLGGVRGAAVASTTVTYANTNTAVFGILPGSTLQNATFTFIAANGASGFNILRPHSTSAVTTISNIILNGDGDGLYSDATGDTTAVGSLTVNVSNSVFNTKWDVVMGEDITAAAFTWNFIDDTFNVTGPSSWGDPSEPANGLTGVGSVYNYSNSSLTAAFGNTGANGILMYAGTVNLTNTTIRTNATSGTIYDMQFDSASGVGLIHVLSGCRYNPDKLAANSGTITVESGAWIGYPLLDSITLVKSGSNLTLTAACNIASTFGYTVDGGTQVNVTTSENMTATIIGGATGAVSATVTAFDAGGTLTANIVGQEKRVYRKKKGNHGALLVLNI
jgi:hypothetical protein